jgi:hypothetical protein
MCQYDSIEVHFWYVFLILWNDFQPLHEVYISNESIELDFYGLKSLFLEWDLNYSQVIKLLKTTELSVIDLDSSYNLAIKEPQSVNFGSDLIKLFSD